MTTVTAVAKREGVRSISLRSVLEWGGVAAGVVLIAFGVAAIALGAMGRATVGSSLAKEKIVGSSDMTPSAIRADAAKSIPNLKSLKIDWPTMNLAGRTIDTGGEARAFAQYMRIHALEATGGKTYSQLPMNSSLRDTWVTETALSTALNTSYMAEQLGNFGVVVGVALLLSGIGFTVLALGGALRKRDEES